MRELAKSLKESNPSKWERMRLLPGGMFHSAVLALEIADVVMSYMINDKYQDIKELNNNIAKVIIQFYGNKNV